MYFWPPLSYSASLWYLYKTRWCWPIFSFCSTYNCRKSVERRSPRFSSLTNFARHCTVCNVVRLSVKTLHHRRPGFLLSYVALLVVHTIVRLVSSNWGVRSLLVLFFIHYTVSFCVHSTVYPNPAKGSYYLTHWLLYFYAKVINVSEKSVLS